MATTFKAKSFQVDETIEEIFVGDSHVRYAIDDSQLINSLNMGNSSESTYFSYYKTKQLLKTNPHITTVYLGFSYHNISAYYDQYTSGQYSLEIASNYFFILPFKEQLQVIKWNFKQLPRFMFSLIKSAANTWINKNTFQGGFDNTHNKVSADESSMDIRLNFQYNSNEQPYSFSNLNIEHFDKIVELCQKKHVELIVLKTPTHPYYQSKTPVIFPNKFATITSSKNQQIMDLSQLSMPDYGYQPDGDLVSKEGATVTTKEIILIKEK